MTNMPNRVLDAETIIPDNLFPLTEEQERELESKMVWVLGTPRSGSTWLCKELLKHDENIIWDEPFIGKVFEVIKNTIESKTRITNLFFHTRFKDNFWLPIFRKLIVTRAYHHSQNFDKNFIIKEPTGGGGSEILMECLPKSKMIFLLRDGRDVTDSFMDAIKPESWKGSRKDHPKSEEEIEKKRPKNIKKYSKKWSSFISAVLKSYDSHNPERRLLVKYEDLRKDTFSELKKIYDFIGIKITEEDLKKKINESAYENVPQSEKGPGKKIRTANPGSYVENFSADEIDLMNSIMGDTLKKVGYSI